jgi:pimeloyl-ACP methyl ester carboxylesterase
LTLSPLLWVAALVAQSPRPAPRAAAESLHVVVSGTGPVLALLAGLFGSAYSFRRVAPLLAAAGYRVIIVEPLGVGSSARPAVADYSLTAQADRIAAVLDSFKVAPVLVVAHSLGAAMAFRLAVRRPDLVRGIVSLEGGPTEEATTPGFRHAMRFAPLLRILGANFARGKIRGMLIESSGDPSWVSEEVVRAYTAGSVRDLGATLRAYRAMGRAREPERLEPRLPEIRCPVRLIVGGAPHDGGTGAEEVELLRRVLPSFAVDSVLGAGHWLQEERPLAVVESVRRLEATVAGGKRGVPGAGGCDARRVGR